MAKDHTPTIGTQKKRACQQAKNNVQQLCNQRHAQTDSGWAHTMMASSEAKVMRKVRTCKDVNTLLWETATSGSVSDRTRSTSPSTFHPTRLRSTSSRERVPARPRSVTLRIRLPEKSLLKSTETLA